MIASYYKGRISIIELMNMKLSYISILYNMAYERQLEEKEAIDKQQGKGNNNAHTISQIPADAIEEAIDEVT